MYQGKQENYKTWLARTLKRRDVFQRRVVWQREEVPNKPWKRPAGSTTDCPGPPEGGALDFRSCKMAFVQTLSSKECSALLAVLPRCRKHLDYLGWRPESNTEKPIGCTEMKKCNRPHAVSAEDPYGDIQRGQLDYFNNEAVTKGIRILPFGTLSRVKRPTGGAELSFQMQPPMQQALKEFFKKHSLPNIVETAHLDEDLQGRQCLRLRVSSGLNAICDEAVTLGERHVYVLEDRDLVRETLNRSQEAPALTYHGTSPDVFLPIVRSGGLLPDPSGETTPEGVFLCPDARVAEMSMYDRGLVVVCKTRGFPFNYAKNWSRLHDYNVIPKGCIGYLRDVLGVKQLCAHPGCLQVEEFVFELSALVKMVDAELGALGYTHQYHTHVTAVLSTVKDRWRMIEEAERLAPKSGVEAAAAAAALAAAKAGEVSSSTEGGGGRRIVIDPRGGRRTSTPPQKQPAPVVAKAAAAEAPEAAGVDQRSHLLEAPAVAQVAAAAAAEAAGLDKRYVLEAITSWWHGSPAQVVAAANAAAFVLAAANAAQEAGEDEEAALAAALANAADAGAAVLTAAVQEADAAAAALTAAKAAQEADDGAAVPTAAAQEADAPRAADRGRKRKREGAAPALAVAEQIGPEDGMEIIQANHDERARELEALALEAQREYQAALAERGGD